VCVHCDLSNEKILIRVLLCDCAAYNYNCNLMNSDNFSLALRSFSTRYGKLEKVMNFEDYSFKKVDPNEIKSSW
jgi:hypothetical protein